MSCAVHHGGVGHGSQNSSRIRVHAPVVPLLRRLGAVGEDALRHRVDARGRGRREALRRCAPSSGSGGRDPVRRPGPDPAGLENDRRVRDRGDGGGPGVLLPRPGASQRRRRSAAGDDGRPTHHRVLALGARRAPSERRHGHRCRGLSRRRPARAGSARRQGELGRRPAGDRRGGMHGRLLRAVLQRKGDAPAGGIRRARHGRRRARRRGRDRHRADARAVRLLRRPPRRPAGSVVRAGAPACRPHCRRLRPRYPRDAIDRADRGLIRGSHRGALLGLCRMAPRVGDPDRLATSGSGGDPRRHRPCETRVRGRTG